MNPNSHTFYFAVTLLFVNLCCYGDAIRSPQLNSYLKILIKH